MDDLTWYEYEALVQAYEAGAIAFTKSELERYTVLRKEIQEKRPSGGDISKDSLDLIRSGGTWVELSEYELQH